MYIQNLPFATAELLAEGLLLTVVVCALFSYEEKIYISNCLCNAISLALSVLVHSISIKEFELATVNDFFFTLLEYSHQLILCELISFQCLPTLCSDLNHENRACFTFLIAMLYTLQYFMTVVLVINVKKVLVTINQINF